MQVIVGEGVRDRRLIEAFRDVPRAPFIPPHLVEEAYWDRPLPIQHGQVTTQPSLVAKMVEALGLRGTEKVLEIGTGYGFQTALLARLASEVWSVERWSDIAETARVNLERFGVSNVTVVVGDGSEGLAANAPFAAILVSAAFPEVPQPLVEQLSTGGCLVQPMGWGGNEDVTLFEKEEGGLVPRRHVTGAHFVRLYGTHGFAVR